MISQESRARGAGPFVLTGWKVLAIALLFFGSISAVDGIMIFYAISTFRGEEDAKAYEHGLAFQKEIAAASAQEARHWSVDGSVAREGGDGPARIAVTMRDAAGAALTGLKVQASLQFATDKKLDRTVDLTETAAGIYTGDAVVPAGRWDLDMVASKDGASLFRSRTRVTLR